MRVLGMDPLARSEGERSAEHGHPLRGEALEIDLDAAATVVIDGAMRKTRQIEIASELAINTCEHVETERGGDAGGVVIGRNENVETLLQVDADQERAAAPEQSADERWLREAARRSRCRGTDSRTLLEG